MSALGANMPGRLDLSLYQGDGHQIRVTLKERDTGAVIDPSGYAWKAQIRYIDPSSNPAVPVAEFAITIEDSILLLYLPKETTQALSYGPFHWDLQGEFGGGIRTYLMGSLIVPRDWTRQGVPLPPAPVPPIGEAYRLVVPVEGGMVGLAAADRKV
jgi:hypothetical protein